MMNTPYFDSNNIFHYYENNEWKTFDCNNENILKLNDKIPKNIANLILEVSNMEFYWDIGDKYNNYYSEVIHNCKLAFGNDIEVPENMYVGLECSSNPCYGGVRYEWIKFNHAKYEFRKDYKYNEKTGLGINGTKGWFFCPRCRLKWALYSSSNKPLKYKILDKLIDIKLYIEFLLRRKIRNV